MKKNTVVFVGERSKEELEWFTKLLLKKQKKAKKK